MLAAAPAIRFLVCLLALLPFPLVARAQDPTPTPTPGPQQMALSSPFALTEKPLSLIARRGRWFPIAVTLSNTGDPVSGELRLKLVANGAFEFPPNESYCPVELPTNSNKVIWLYGRMERPDIAAAEITFSGRGFTRLTQRVPIQEPAEGQRLVLTISEGDRSLSETFLSLRGRGLALPGTAATTVFPNSQGPIRPLQTVRSGVPDRWFGMEAADLVVLGDFPHTGLLPPQLAALRGFVEGGGNLLALGGANASRLSSSPLADLWPGRITTSGSAAASEVQGIVSRYVDTPRNGADRLGGSPVVVTRSTLKPGAGLRAGTAARPLFSMLDTGAGRTLFLGFDPSQPPFNGWSGQNSLWQDVLGAMTPLRRLDGVDGDNLGPGASANYQPGMNSSFDEAPPSSPTGSLLSALSKAPQARMPPVSKIAWFLSLYVFVLVPLNYAILRYIDRRELAWITIPVIVAVFSAFAYFAALSIRGNAILTRQVDVLQSSLGSKSGRADSLLWLFSPKATTYDISSSRNDAAVDDYANVTGGRQGAFSLLQPADATSFKVEGANIWMWTDRGFVSHSLADLGKGVTLQGRKVVNGTPFDLRGAVWVQDHAVRRIGSVKSGASVPIPANVTTQVESNELPGAITSASNIDAIFSESTISNGIPNAAIGAALGENFGLDNEGAMLVAWIKKSTVPLSIGMDDVNSSNFSLLVVRAPVLSGAGMASREAVVKRLSSEAVMRPDGSQPVAGQDFVEESYQCTLPPAKVWNLNIRGSRNNSSISPPPGFNGGVSAMPVPGGPPIVVEARNNRSNRWVALSGTLRNDNSTQRGWNFLARITPDFQRQPDRILQLRVRRSSTQVQISNLKIVSQ
jgi:hypothetical protein